MKKILSILIAVVILLGAAGKANVRGADYGSYIKDMPQRVRALTPAQIQTALSKFKDMGTHWSRTSVGRMAAVEIITGYPDGTFKPENNVQVDQFLKMVIKGIGFTPQEGDTYWADPYIEIAQDIGVIGYNEFSNYARNITREEAAKIVMKAVMREEQAPDASATSMVRAKIKDYTSIGDMLKQSVLDGYVMGIFNGNPDGKFNPKGTLKRSEAAAMVYRYLDEDSRTPFKPATSEALFIKNVYGKYFAVTPPKASLMERYNAAIVLEKAVAKSKGHSYIITNPEVRSVVMYCYKSRESKKEDMFSQAMNINVLSLDNEGLAFPYNITIYKPQEVSDIHKDVITEVFKFWFEGETEKAIAEFNKCLEIAKKAGKAIDNSYTFNKRKVVMYTVENQPVLTVRIYHKK